MEPTKPSSKADKCDVYRDHPAEEVFVTGTFDSWTKSAKLDKTDTGHELTFALPRTDEKILYKVCTRPDYEVCA